MLSFTISNSFLKYHKIKLYLKNTLPHLEEFLSGNNRVTIKKVFNWGLCVKNQLTILRKCLHTDPDKRVELCKIHQYLSAYYLFYKLKS